MLQDNPFNLMKIFKVRESASFGPLEGLSLALYSVILAIASSHHEAWLDEAQAWLIARDCSLREIFLKRLHYEGTPGLWHLYLWVLARLHVSYAGMHWISAGLAVFAIFLLLRYSPFPAAIRLLLPFTFFLQYQFSVIPRSYLFFVIAVFAMAALFSRPQPKPVSFSLIAGLMANTSLFGAVAAFGFELSYLISLHKRRKLDSRIVSSDWLLRSIRRGVILFLALFIVAIYTAIPTPDESYGRLAVKNQRIEHLLYSMILLPPPRADAAHLAVSSAPPTDPAPDLLQHNSNSLHDRLWRFLVLRQGISKANLLARKLGFRLYITYCVLAYPVASQNWIALPFLVLCASFFIWRRQVYLLWGLVFLGLFCVLLQVAPHHAGLVWIALVAALWIALTTRPRVDPPQWLVMTFFVAFLMVVAGQILWSIHAVRTDYRSNYDGSKDAADFILRLPPGKQIAAFTHHTAAIQPYFPRNPFFNEPTTYWMWSKADDPDQSFSRVLAHHPDLVVIADSRSGDELVENQLLRLRADRVLEPPTVDLRALSRYSFVARFCGQLYIRLGYEQQICYLFFVPNTSGAAASAEQLK